MAILSVNQLVSETRKAMIGKGYSFGVSDDIARAIEWLAGFGVVPSDELVRLVQAPVEERVQKPEIAGTTISQRGRAVGIYDVMAALDFCEAYEAAELAISGLIYPVISCGLIAKRATPPLGQFVDAAGQNLSQICQMPQMQEAQEAQEMGRPDLILQRVPFRPYALHRWPARITIDDAAYQMLKTIAFETYVPSSDQSRAAGAGAGLNDND